MSVIGANDPAIRSVRGWRQYTGEWGRRGVGRRARHRCPIRTDQGYCGAVVSTGGIITGAATQALTFRRAVGAKHLAVAADVYDRTSAPLGDLPIAAMADLAHRHGHADALIATGHSVEDSLARIREIKRAIPDAVVLAGGGTTQNNVGSFLACECYTGCSSGVSGNNGGYHTNPTCLEGPPNEDPS
ncbi:MAG TPA: BtpA/SgcQ family protein [Vicinamibacterales bacterium]|nr:BtpA/SgcQ family protein [Vicinamibacterales bacterium]